MAAMDGNERKKVRDRAIKARKLALSRMTSRPVIEVEEDEEDDTPMPIRKPTLPLEEFILRILTEEVAAPEPVKETQVGTVIALHRKRCEVVLATERVDCILTPDQAKWQQSQFAVGDLVNVVNEDEIWRIQDVHPRRTKLSRPDPGSAERERVIVANIDVIVVVVSVKAPPLHPRVIDRYLIAIQRGQLGKPGRPNDRLGEFAKLLGRVHGSDRWRRHRHGSGILPTSKPVSVKTSFVHSRSVCWVPAKTAACPGTTARPDFAP